MQSLKKISDRAGEIAVLADGLKSPVELAAYADEVGLLLQQAVQAGNARLGSDYLFGGTRTDAPPFVATTEPDGSISTVAYQGNTSASPAEIDDGLALSAQIPGASTGAGDPPGLLVNASTGADLFAHLVALRKHLEDRDIGAIASTDRNALATDEENLVRHLSGIGVIEARLETATSIHASRELDLTRRISDKADVDIAPTLVELNRTQTAYQVALQSGARILDLSLLDFIR